MAGIWWAPNGDCAWNYLAQATENQEQFSVSSKAFDKNVDWILLLAKLTTLYLRSLNIMKDPRLWTNETEFWINKRVNIKHHKPLIILRALFTYGSWLLLRLLWSTDAKSSALSNDKVFVFNLQHLLVDICCFIGQQEAAATNNRGK